MKEIFSRYFVPAIFFVVDRSISGKALVSQGLILVYA
jgi:hypothetical protein